jgi:glycosyltransferase involved in cell wall biosynthesis
MDRLVIIVLAHNEAPRIAGCLASLPLGEPNITCHVVVNGSSDRTAEIARSFPVIVHDWPEGGKSRSWNRIMLDTPGIEADFFALVDGDSRILPGSFAALTSALRSNPNSNAAAGLPANGRRAEAYRRETTASHGLFGDLYALRGSFVERLRQTGIRLPDDLIGDDGLVGAMAKTDFSNEVDWQDSRIVPCPEAGFLCETTKLTPASLRVQYRRMINYSVRHFQNQMIIPIMRGPGPAALPRRMAELYPEWLHRLSPRRDPKWWWFDRLALARMRAASAAA